MFNQSFNNSKLRLFDPLINNPDFLQSDRQDLPLLLYFPGMDGTGELFGNQIPWFAPHFNLRCLAIPADDMSDWTQLTKAATNCILAELATTAQTQVYICGESFGACLTMSVALQIPQHIKGLIVVNSASSFNKQPILGLGINLIPLLPTWLHRNSAIGMLPFLAELNRLSAANWQALLAAMKSLPQEVVSWRLRLLKEYKLDPQVCRKFLDPVLFVASKRDKLLPSVTEAEKLRELFANSNTETLPDSGHACLLEEGINLFEIARKNNFFQSH